MKMNKRLFGFLLALVLALVLLPGMSLTAYAYDNNPYAALVNTTTPVKFNSIDWYIIADNSTAKDEGTITLLMKDPMTAMPFLEGGSEDWTNKVPISYQYSSSTVKKYLDGLTNEDGSFASVADAIAPTDLDLSYEVVFGAKIYLPSPELVGLSSDILKCTTADGSHEGNWWRRTPGNYHSSAGSVDGVNGQNWKDVAVGRSAGVRPALRLDLSKVTFDTGSKTFSLKVAVTSVTLDKTTAQTIDVDGTVTFTATVAPDGATDKTVKWSSSSDSVKLYSDETCTTEVGADATETLTVYAKGISAGSATVTVTSNANSTKSASCGVTVQKPVATVTKDPEAAQDLVFTGELLPLVTAGETEDGTMVYAVTTTNMAPTDESYTDSIPEKTDAGTYYVWYKVKGDNNHRDSEPESISVTISIPGAPELTDEQKPKAKENLTDTGEPQELVTPPEKLPDGYQKVQYSIDGGETWTDEVPKGTKTGSYTVKVKYVASDGNHTDFFGEDILVTIGTAMNIRVDLINLLYNGQRTLPKEIKELSLNPVIHIALDETESVSRNLTFDLEQGMDNPKKYEKVEFTAKVEDLAPGKYEVTVTGLPKVVYGQEDDIYSADDGMIEGRVLWKYALTAKAEINVKKDSGTNKEETVITVYLIWDDGSRPEEIKVYALPEDEIGAYALRADGTKEYLLFHTYDICMNYLGRDELCRGYERCFHKESPYVNPFVQP